MTEEKDISLREFIFSYLIVLLLLIPFLIFPFSPNVFSALYILFFFVIIVALIVTYDET